MNVTRAKDYQNMSRQAANIISAQVIMKPNCVLGLATGSTPLGTYKQLIEWYKKGDLDFSKVSSVNLDEYLGLSPDDEQSYFYFMKHNFFQHINILTNNTYIPDGTDSNTEHACKTYNQVIKTLGGIDLQLLGIGANGHIGFNEPGEYFETETHCVALAQNTIEANARFFADKNEVPTHAYTMGIKSIMQAKKIIILANGKSKADAVFKAFWGPITPQIPASILQLHPDITLIADEEALALSPV